MFSHSKLHDPDFVLVVLVAIVGLGFYAAPFVLKLVETWRSYGQKEIYQEEIHEEGQAIRRRESQESNSLRSRTSKEDPRSNKVVR